MYHFVYHTPDVVDDNIKILFITSIKRATVRYNRKLVYMSPGYNLEIQVMM